MSISKSLQSILTQNFYRTGLQVGVLQPVFFALLLLAQNLGVVVIAPAYTSAVSIWTALNVLSLVGVVRSGLLGGGKSVKKCVHCGSKRVVPATFLCLDCESSTLPPKELRDKIGKA